VVARSLLLVDLEQGGMLLDTLPLPRDGIARGLAVDSYKNRAFILHDDGLGGGTVHRIDLYDGRRVERETGVVPDGVGRKGLVLDRNARTVFCLAGGDASRPDFAPITDREPAGPVLIALDADSLTVVERIPLGERFQPQALAYDEARDRVYVLTVREGGSELVVVDAAFTEQRSAVSLPEETTDLVVSGGYAFLPGAHGIYIVDLDLESLISHPYLPLELTGEIVVSDDQSIALVSFQAAETAGPPGIAKVGLRVGNLMDVLR
jgi:DNA-binding beta-propeller fold protein YncE